MNERQKKSAEDRVFVLLDQLAENVTDELMYSQLIKTPKTLQEVYRFTMLRIAEEIIKTHK